MATPSEKSALMNFPSQYPGAWDPLVTNDFLDATTFEQLLDMDDDIDREFSRGVVESYFRQVRGSFAPFEEGMYVLSAFFPYLIRYSDKRDFKILSSLSNFLKGSSAVVSLLKLTSACDKMENYSNKMDETGAHPVMENYALEEIAKILIAIRLDVQTAEAWCKLFYRESPSMVTLPPQPVSI